MERIIRYFIKFIKAKKNFFPPKKVDVLIYDKTGTEDLIKYFKKYNFSILCTRGEEVNLYIMLKSILKFEFNYRKYIQNYINEVKPKIIITLVDNNSYFYSLKKKESTFKTVFIQKSVRTYFNDIFNKIDELKKKPCNVDVMFVANKHVGKIYSSFIKGKVIPIGYFRNNSIKIRSGKKLKEILIISVFRTYDKKKIIYKNISFADFFKNDQKFYSWLNKFCEINNLKINILARSHLKEDFFNEKKYFKNFFPNSNVIYEKNNPYKWIDKYEYVVTNDSTLGVENISRGGKTAFVCNSPHVYPLTTRKFGYNENFANEGPFWTKKNQIENFNRVLKFLIEKKKSKWANYSKEALNYDKNNKTFQDEIKKLLK